MVVSASDYRAVGIAEETGWRGLLYHTFIDAIGAVYDWNALFDGFPGSYPKCYNALIKQHIDTPQKMANHIDKEIIRLRVIGNKI